MSLAWRIGTDAPDYTADDLTGVGAELTGGRWNRKGTRMVYAASSPALACLETIVHLNAGDLPLNRYLVQLDIPDRLIKAAFWFDPITHVGWDAIPAGQVSLDAGERWVKGGASAVMIVPSVIVLEEVNYLINPKHADARKISTKKIRKWAYDMRLRPS
ncbi:MAG: RES domain-containing protein [Alphaproteobacteria bacterium]|nr:RES domain-containing protein [Alphaproteobacteria bacterium]